MKNTSYTVRFYFTKEDFCDHTIEAEYFEQIKQAEHLLSAMRKTLAMITEAKDGLLVIALHLPDGRKGGRILNLASVTYVDIFPNH